MISTATAASIGILAAAFALGAIADDRAPPTPPAAAPAAPTAAATASIAPTTPPLSLGASKPLTAEALGEQRAAAKLEIDKVTINAPTQNGVVAGNAAIGTTTGGNSIGGAAFTGAAGLVSTIQNTGNNVLIQNSTIVNVSVAP